MKSKSAGFTLIEVLIAVAIVGIVAVVAIPTYRTTVERSNRADAIVDLSEVAQRLQRCFTNSGRFDPPVGCQVYQDLINPVGINTRRGFYNITMFNDGNDANNAFAYQIRATAINGLAQADDADCDIFSINQAGVRASLNDQAVVSTALCWR